MQLQDCINFQLTMVQNSVFSYFKGQLAPYDVTPSQYALLSCLWEKDGQSPTQLAQTLNLDTSSMTGLLTRMEGKDLIRREFSTEDRRAVIIHITPLGLSLKGEITRAIEEANHTVLRGITPEEDRVLRRCLTTLFENTQ